MQIFSNFKLHFHNERGLGPKRYFQVFFRAPQNLTAHQISKWPDTPFRFFANIYPIFGKYMTGIFLLQYFNSSLKSVAVNTEPCTLYTCGPCHVVALAIGRPSSALPLQFHTFKIAANICITDFIIAKAIAPLLILLKAGINSSNKNQFDFS